jgi:thiol-disulfide isomerase/thioredoxin
LAGDAISARPASTIYQLRVFARRNKGVLTSVAAVILVLFAGAIVSGSLYLRSRNYQIQVREQEAKTLGAQNFLQDIMASLKGAMGDEIKVSRLLEVFAGKIDERFADQPEAESSVRLLLAQKYSFLTAYTAGAEAKKFAELAEENFHRVLELRRQLYGENDPGTTELIEEVANHLAIGFDLERAEFWYREALRRRDASGNQDLRKVVRLRRQLAGVLASEGRLKEAESINREVLQSCEKNFGLHDAETRLAREQQAWFQQLHGDLELAATGRRKLLEEAHRNHDSNPDGERRAVTRLANLYVTQGKANEAAAMYQTSLLLSTRRLGIEKWLNQEYSLRSDAPTLLFFWESWCPYCQLTITKFNDIVERNGGTLQVVGMTSLNLGMHEEDAQAFIARNHLEFPNAIYDGKIFKELELGGWPAVVALRDGKIVWWGHPSWISPGFVRGLVRDG